MAPALPAHALSFCPFNGRLAPSYDPPEAARPLWLQRPCGAAMRDTVADPAAAERRPCAAL